LSAHGIIHLLAAQAPINGTEPSIIPVNVIFSSGGRNSWRSGAGPFFSTRWARASRHAGDSGRKKSTTSPNPAGAAARLNSHRHDSALTDQICAICESRRIPALIAAPINPANVGRALSGQHSATSATAFGQTPPTPKPTKKRRTSICSC
jgi:hypothetical protein